MDQDNKWMIISSYDEEVKYYKDVIDGKEHRSPIFTGPGENGKSSFFKMIQNGDLDEAKVDAYFNKINNL